MYASVKKEIGKWAGSLGLSHNSQEGYILGLMQGADYINRDWSLYVIGTRSSGYYLVQNGVSSVFRRIILGSDYFYYIYNTWQIYLFIY